MEEAGAGLGIIVDTNKENITRIVMSDDGSGAGLRIPAVLVSKEDGDKLIDFMSTASKDELDQLLLLAEFDIKRPDNRVEYDVWYSSANDVALDFFEDFIEVDKKFGKSVLMTPRFVFWECRNCDDAFKRENCFRDGQYCATSKTRMTGQ